MTRSKPVVTNVMKRRGPGRPLTTGSGATRPIQFRVGAEERKRGEDIATGQGIEVGELARRAFRKRIKGG